MTYRHLITSLFVTLLAFPALVSAQASPSGTIRDTVKQQVEAELAQIKKGVAKKGFVGSITTKSDVNLTVNNLQNQIRHLVLSTDTTIKLTGSKDGTISDLKVGDYILAMGDVDSQNTMTVKRLLVIPAPPAEKRSVVYGTVSKPTSSAFTLTTTKNETRDIKVTAGTKFNSTTKLTDLKDGSKVVVIESATTTSGKTTHTALGINLFAN